MPEPFEVLHRVVLAGRFLPTGRTRHFRGGVQLPAPHELCIARFAGDAGVYLLYLDEAGEEMTDTYHDSVARAAAQAEFEFGIRPEDWIA